MSVDSFSIEQVVKVERERDCMVLAHESFVLAWFLIESRNGPINLVTTASDEDP